MQSTELTPHIAQDLEHLSWYHPSLDRHITENLLIQNAADGTYLLRPRSKQGQYVLSVKCRQSVKHFLIVVNGNEVRFGLSDFTSINDFLHHFRNRPLIRGDTGDMILLKQAYPRIVQEPHEYDSITLHASLSVDDECDSKEKVDYSMNSKEGFLTKLGHFFKTWKTRWFVLRNNKLSYYREKFDAQPIKVLDLSEALECSLDRTTHVDRKNVFRLWFTWRTFYMYASTETEMKEWVKFISWRINKDRELNQVEQTDD